MQEKSALAIKMRQTLDALFEKCDLLLGERADINYNGSVLTIDFDDGGTCVINSHQASGQIWVSSPISGAHHFSPTLDGGWQSHKTTLSDVMRDDFGVS